MRFVSLYSLLEVYIPKLFLQYALTDFWQTVNTCSRNKATLTFKFITPPDEFKSIIWSLFCSDLVSTNSWERYLPLQLLNAKVVTDFLSVWCWAGQFLGPFHWKQLPALAGNYTDKSSERKPKQKSYSLETKQAETKWSYFCDRTFCLA